MAVAEALLTRAASSAECPSVRMSTGAGSVLHPKSQHEKEQSYG
jgi:hypothetical protein